MICVDQSVRDRAVTTLKKWLKAEGEKLSYEEYLKLWKGLFFAMWMADKPKYQQELAERLASMARVLSSEMPAAAEEESEEPEDMTTIMPPCLLFVRSFWETMCREWRGIDRLRLNKYYALMKEMMMVSTEMMHKADFDREFSSLYFAILAEFPLK